MKSLIFLFVVLLAFSGCGTDTGNPNMMNTKPNLDQQDFDFIGTNICQKLEVCYPHKTYSCKAQILSAKNLTASLGLNAKMFPNLKSVHEEISKKNLNLSVNSVADCHDAIEQLPCNDPNVINSFDAANPSNYDQSFNLLNATQSCHHMIY